jgi:phage tail-like protein
MRGLVEGLPTAHPLGREVPGALQEDDFCQRMLGALDEVVAPIYCALDCWDSYLDPTLAPEDFVEWLAAWVGIEVDETWTIPRRRRLIQDAAMLYRIRGTAAGLAAHVSLYAGVAPEIEDSGGCTWSQTTGAPLSGSAQPRLTVRLTVDDPLAAKWSTVNRIVGASCPAHVPYQVEVLVGGAALPGAEPAVSGETDGHAPGAVDLPGSERVELAPQAPPTVEDLEQPPDGTTDGDQSAS